MNILGLHEGHNATACLMKDGEIVACVSEERFQRKKNWAGYPEKAIEFCLKQGQINAEDLDAVAAQGFRVEIPESYNLDPQKLIASKVEAFEKRKWERHVPETVREMVHPYLEKRYKEKESTRGQALLAERKKRITKHLDIPESKIKVVEHHIAHGYYAYYASPIRDDCLVLTCDEYGDGLSASVSSVIDGKFERIEKDPSFPSIGAVYANTTLLLGFKPGEHEYKVMGLAPYAKLKDTMRAFPVFNELVHVDGLKFSGMDLRYKPLYLHLREKLVGHRFDWIAGALQKFLEDSLTKWVKNAIERTGIKIVTFSGGVAMNVKGNMAIAKMSEVENVFVAPSGGDESTGVGAAYKVMADYCDEHSIDKRKIKPLKDTYLGPEFSNTEIHDAIREVGLKNKYSIREGVDAKFIAEKLAENRIIARLSGRMEFGARALGNRTIMANPSDINNVRTLNEQIKQRDFWMPFTPTILKKSEESYLLNPKGLHAPFMTLAFETTDLAREHICAAIHPYDFSARPQVLFDQANRPYHEIIDEFHKITNIGAILNTSFNLHGYPIVCSPKDAIYTFENSGLDMLLCNDILISRVDV
ncbi:MAG: carbamoyltransferase [Thermoplasmata archaeon]|nr:MAG: carbamoyltransferase [Thermoplasmata archaeon]